MATQTPNLGLTLPVGGENVSRQIINQNMTLIDQYCGAINQSTYRLVPFTLAVNDWVSSGGQWVVDFSTAYVTASSDEIITFGSSLTNAQAHIIAEKRSGGGGVKFTTATKPTGAIQGMIRIFDNDDHKIPILVEGTVTPIANGGTGQSNLSGAQQALGITALSNQIKNYTNDGAQKQIIGTDLNTLKIAGRYFYNNTCTNRPSTSDGYIDVYVFNASYVKQIAHETVTFNSFVRYCNNGTWSSWERISTINVKQENITSDANSIIDLGISTSYAVISVFATLTNDVTCLPYRDTTGWKARLVNAKTGAALGEYNRSFMIVYVSV